jgi:hypothetical protein
MHTHTVRTKYTFGDRVRYATQWNDAGIGTIVSICFEPDLSYYYFIEVDESRDIQGGIEDGDITPLTDDPDVSAPIRVQ